MDSVTQIVLGAAVGQASAGRQMGRKAPLWGAIMGTVPDLDVFISYGDAVSDFTYHRSATHSLIIMLLAAPLLAWLITKWQARANRDAQQTLFWPWLRLIFLCFATHALLDAFTIYGTQLFWPLDNYPVAFGSLFIIDPLYTLPLLGLLLMSLRHQGSRRAMRYNFAGLWISSGYIVWSLMAQQNALAVARKAIAQQQIPSTGVLVTPAPLNTALWRIVIINEQHYYDGYWSVFDAPETPLRLTRFARHLEYQESLPDSWYLQRLYWFSKGFYKLTKDQNGALVVSDLRMGMEPFYAFNFVFETASSAPPTLTSSPRDSTQLPKLWQRLWDPSVRLVPPSSALD